MAIVGESHTLPCTKNRIYRDLLTSVAGFDRKDASDGVDRKAQLSREVN
jgi:hypothetical protein